MQEKTTISLKKTTPSLRDWVALHLVLIGLFFVCSLFSPNAALSGVKDYEFSYRDQFFATCQVDDNTGWAVGLTGLMLKTTDGGKTWKQLDAITKFSLNSIFFVKNKGWIVGNNGLVLYTENGGDSWTKQTSNTDANLLKVFFKDENYGISVGAVGTVIFTEDGGKSWQPAPIDFATIIPEALQLKGIFAPNLYDVLFVNANQGFISGDSGIFLETLDGGKTWKLTVNEFMEPIYSLCFKNESEGFACGGNGLLMSTKDGGKTWVKLSVPATLGLFHVSIKDGLGLAVGEKGTVLYSADGGTTWSAAKLTLPPPLPWFSDAWAIGSKSGEKQLILIGQFILNIPFSLN